jgi:integrase
MPKLNERLPKYRLHRRSGQGIVTINGKDHYLGPHGCQTSKIEYDRIVAEWLAHGRQAPQPVSAAQPSLTVNELLLAFWEHAQNYYRRPDGTLTSEVTNLRQILRLLRSLHGNTSATEFGPRALKTIREQMIALKWHRKSINKQISRVKMIFRWAVENEMLPPYVHQALQAVRGLSKGRTDAPESLPIRPVPEDLIAPIQTFVSRQVWALVQLQLLTGARAGELVLLRGIDLKTGDAIWTVEPDQHKTSHLGHSKRIYFGPQAKMIVQEYLLGRALDAYLFSPVEAEKERRLKQHAGRKTAASCGNRPGKNRKKNPRWKPDEHYTVTSYRRAIKRGCDAAFPPPEHLARIRAKDRPRGSWETPKEWKARLGPERWAELKAWQRDHRWHPHQLRHNAATKLRKEFGIEVARIILGHQSASVTEIYAEVDDEKAKSIMNRVG